MTDLIITQKQTKIYTLTTDCVIHLHDLLSKNYHLVDDMDPVEPPGVKDLNTLESTIFRQQVGSGDWYKYNTIFNNCATLVYGIIKNHPFHNGNKRVAFLSMIKHLFENGYVIKPNTSHQRIYDTIVSIAAGTFPLQLEKIDKKLYKGQKYKYKEKWTDESIVELISLWIKSICESKSICFKSKVKIQLLRDILLKKDIQLEVNGTWLTLYKVKHTTKFFGMIKSREERFSERKYGIGNSMNEVGIKVINQIRKDFELTQKDGFDNNTFYDSNTFIDEEMTVYKQIIYKLSKT